MMDAHEINEIKKRWQMASMKPWYTDCDYREGGANQVLDACGLTVCFMSRDSSGLVDEFDTDFIVHSILDIPALIAEVERISAELVVLADKPMIETCKWVRHPIEMSMRWKTECGNHYSFMFNDIEPEDEKFIYCPYCGRKIEV